jgi:basic membrane protein A
MSRINAYFASGRRAFMGFKSLKRRLSFYILSALFILTAALTAAPFAFAADTPVSTVPGASSGEVSLIYFMPVGSLSNPFIQMAEVGIHLSASLYPQIKTSRIYLYHDRRMEDYIKGILAAGDHAYIVGIGSNYADIFDELADIYTDRHFIVIDARSANGRVKSIEFDNFEAGYMAGSAAAAITKSRKTGFIGGTRNKVILDFENGFKSALLKNLPAVKEGDIMVEYVAAGVEGFSDTAAGEKLADKMYAAGCDIIFAAAGASGLGAIESAKKRGRYIIGVDSDQDSIAPGRVVTSVIKRMDSAIINLAKDIASNKYDNKPIVYSFNNAGLTFSAFKHTKNKIGVKKYNKIFNALFSR